MAANCKELMELQLNSRHGKDSTAYFIKFFELFGRLSAEDVASLFTQLGIKDNRDFNTIINAVLDDPSDIELSLSMEELKRHVESIAAKNGLTPEQKDAILLRIGV